MKITAINWKQIKATVLEEGDTYICFEEECKGLLCLQREASRYGLDIYHDDDEGSYYAVLA